MPTINGVSCTELPESNESWSRDEQSGQRVYCCEWADRATAIAGILGYTEVYGDEYVITQPRRYSESSYLRARTVDGVESLGEQNITALERLFVVLSDHDVVTVNDAAAFSIGDRRELVFRDDRATTDGRRENEYTSEPDDPAPLEPGRRAR